MKRIEELYGSLLPKSPKSKAYKRKVPQTTNDYKRLAQAKIKRDKKRLDRVEVLAWSNEVLAWSNEALAEAEVKTIKAKIKAEH